MKKVTVEDIYIELESIFDNLDGYERRIKVYQKLNELMPKWEGYEPTTESETGNANLNIGCVINCYMEDCLIQESCMSFKTKKCNKDCKLYQ